MHMHGKPGLLAGLPYVDWTKTNISYFGWVRY